MLGGLPVTAPALANAAEMLDRIRAWKANRGVASGQWSVVSGQ